MNDRKFLQHVLRLLEDQGFIVWLFGGWAEELHGLSMPRVHADIDLLYPAADFQHMDSFLQKNSGWREILSKKFPHKRAVMFQGVMVEFVLIQKGESGMHTRFFDRVRFDWPDDTLRNKVSLNGKTVNVASRTALHQYRIMYPIVQQACRDYLVKQVGPLHSM